MEFEGKVTKRIGEKVTIEIDNVNWFDINKKATGKVTVYFEEKNKISDQQRRLLFALWRDYEIYTGTPIDAAEAWFKYQYMLDNDLDGLPSLSRGNMSKDTATDFITYTLEYYLDNGIPFAQQDWYKGADVNRICYAMLMNRICAACGEERSDIHHATNLVGMGNKRGRHEHVKSTFICLCRKHHQEVHSTGLKMFCDKYHVVPIKLNESDVKELRF